MAVGRGPDFLRTSFNTCGQSPLVAQFLRMKNLQTDAGMHLHIQRTEIDNLPPYPFYFTLVYRLPSFDSYRCPGHLGALDYIQGHDLL